MHARARAHVPVLGVLDNNKMKEEMKTEIERQGRVKGVCKRKERITGTRHLTGHI